MAQQSIKFIIQQDGTVTEEVIGAVGNECESLTKNIEEKLGVVQRVERKPEYYEQKQTTEDHVSLHIHKDKNKRATVLD